MMNPRATSSPSPQKKLSAGSEIDAWCTRCRMDLGHRIVAMVGTAPKRVICLTCGSVHNYRPAAGSPQAKASGQRLGRQPRRSAKRQEGQACKVRDAKSRPVPSGRHVSPAALRSAAIFRPSASQSAISCSTQVRRRLRSLTHQPEPTSRSHSRPASAPSSTLRTPNRVRKPSPPDSRVPSGAEVSGVVALARAGAHHGSAKHLNHGSAKHLNRVVRDARARLRPMAFRHDPLRPGP